MQGFAAVSTQHSWRSIITHTVLLFAANLNAETHAWTELSLGLKANLKKGGTGKSLSSYILSLLLARRHNMKEGAYSTFKGLDLTSSLPGRKDQKCCTQKCFS